MSLRKVLGAYRLECRAGAIAILLLGGSIVSQAQLHDLPAGLMQAKVQTACTECHDSHIIMQQRLGPKIWTKEVDKMIRWGALVSPGDRDPFIDYLSINFPPEKATDPVTRVEPR